MPSFSEQMASARTAHLAVNTVEDSARTQISQALDAWDAGLLDAQTVRHTLERIIRTSYRGSVALAVAQVARQTEIPGWTPQERVFVTPYLTALIADVRRNLREYKADGRSPEARRRAMLRMSHSAGVAAQRGYTDALVTAYGEVADLGLTLRKIWMANFEGNLPCPQCIHLHGTEVGLHDEFPTGDFHAPYLNLLGPPAHPHCRCYLCVLVVSLANIDDDPKIDHPAPQETSMTAAKVRSLGGKMFDAFMKFLTKAAGLLKGK